MGFLTAVFIYLLIWWLTLFTVLPMGIERHQEEGKGFDAGAPKDHRLKLKLIINTVLSGVILLIIEALIRFDVIRWHAWFEGAYL